MKKKLNNKEKKIIIGVSGGADSMFLLHEIKKKYENKNIIVCFVNYNLRSESILEEKLVINYCLKNNLYLKILNVKEKPKNNLQNWARIIRYDFFKKIYIKNNCDALFLAHHKDDFLETCFYQLKNNPNKLFYGIHKYNVVDEMNVVRPLINKYFKKQIYFKVKRENIPYLDDKSNFSLKYERNKIRNDLNRFTFKEKNEMIYFFKALNKKNKDVVLEINNYFLQWKEKKFNTKFFKSLPYKDDLITLFINCFFKNVNLNHKIINNIKNFIYSNNNNVYFKLSNNQKIFKNNFFLFACC